MKCVIDGLLSGKIYNWMEEDNLLNGVTVDECMAAFDGLQEEALKK